MKPGGLRIKVHIALSCLEDYCKDRGAECLPVVVVWKGAAWAFKDFVSQESDVALGRALGCGSQPYWAPNLT